MALYKFLLLLLLLLLDSTHSLTHSLTLELHKQRMTCRFCVLGGKLWFVVLTKWLTYSSHCMFVIDPTSYTWCRWIKSYMYEFSSSGGGESHCAVL